MSISLMTDWWSRVCDGDEPIDKTRAGLKYDGFRPALIYSMATTNLVCLFGFHARHREEGNQQQIHYQSGNLQCGLAQVVMVFKFCQTQSGADYTHQGSTGNESRSQQCAFVYTGFVENGIFRAAAYIPADKATDYQRGVQFQRNEHTQCECQSRDIQPSEHYGQNGPTVAADTRVPRNFHVSCLRGVVPIQ